MLLSVFCLTTLMWSASGSEDWIKGVRDEDGVLVINPPGQAMNPFGGPYPILSANYPGSAPNNIRQHWRYVSVPRESGEKTALKVICYDIRLPQGVSCQDSSFTIEDGDENTEYCGTVEPFTFISNSDDIRGILKVGLKGEAFVNCTAEAILVGPNKEEITTPRPTRPSYLTDDSEEIDSEEHGGPEGDKGTTCPCGWANKITQRIVNGTVTAPNEFPFAAALVEKKSLWQFCGAAIITAWHGLTAAHCTIGWRENEPMALIVGEHDLKDDANAGPSQVIDVVNIVEHDGYGPGKYRDDISLLILGQKIIFSPQVGPACLPTHQYDLTKQYIKIIGWGAIYWRGPGSDQLRKVDVRVVDRKECNYVYPSYVKKDDPTHLCTYAKGKASCQGDSGGPVIWVDPETNRYTLVGLVSFGRVCADNSPSVHTDVGAYLDWIQHFVSVSKSDAEICYKED